MTIGSPPPGGVVMPCFEPVTTIAPGLPPAITRRLYEEINRIATAVPPYDVHRAFLAFGHLMFRDDERRAADDVQKLTDKVIAEIDKLTQGKEAEILAV